MNINIGKTVSKQKNSATLIIGEIKCVIPLEGKIDIEKEKKRIQGQIEEQKKASTGLSKRLKDKDFLQKAPKDVVEKDNERLESLTLKIQKLEQVIAEIN